VWTLCVGEEYLATVGIRQPYHLVRSLVLHAVVSCVRWWLGRSLFKLGSTEFYICDGLNYSSSALSLPILSVACLEYKARQYSNVPHRIILFGWPCPLNCMNNNQHDALFIFSLLSYRISTCFGRISSPSSGGRMYICGNWYLLYCSIDCQGAGPGPRPGNWGV
jgi:hypothetical protein